MNVLSSLSIFLAAELIHLQRQNYFSQNYFLHHLKIKLKKETTRGGELVARPLK